MKNLNRGLLVLILALVLPVMINGQDAAIGDEAVPVDGKTDNEVDLKDMWKA